MFVDSNQLAPPRYGVASLSTQEFIAGDLITKRPDEQKFCMYCGSLCEDDELRSWHIKNEHPDIATRDPIFCVCCGDNISSLNRVNHYKTHQSR